MKVAAIGDNVVDIYLDQQKMYLGGNALNFANMATEFPGVRSMYVGNFGNDQLSDYVQRTLTMIDVDHRYAKILNGESGYSRVTLRNGDRVFINSNKGGVLKQGIKLSSDALKVINEVDLVHFNVNGNADEYLTQISEPTIVYDYSDFTTPQDISRTLPLVDIACFSRSGLADSKINTFIDDIKKLQHKDDLTILITRGSKGALAVNDDQIFEQPALPVAEVIDTMGAGDSFITAFSITLVQTGSINTALDKASHFSAKQIQINGSFGHGATAPKQYLK